ncbi:hypothetical protein NIES2109_55550 (plasmid) [Nostoc sp. HK-01]|nr:hypothetical protein NIES2109_55550 [Nostoc sp. HK-01]
MDGANLILYAAIAFRSESENYPSREATTLRTPPNQKEQLTSTASSPLPMAFER